jgi:glyoxylate reductase
MPRSSSKTPTVFVTRKIPDEGLQLLKDQGYKVEVYAKDQVIPRAELLKRVKGVDALLPLLTDKIDSAILKAAGASLKIIANYAVGFDNIDLEAAKAAGIPVTNAPAPEVSESVAEHTITLMLALAHRIVESDNFARSGKYTGWSPNLLLGTDLRNKTLGIIGLGRIGYSVGRRATLGLGMRCVYQSPRRDPAFEKECGGKQVSLEQLLKTADVISVHVPLLSTTVHLLSTEEFSLMKQSTFVINTARGPIVDEKALLRALKTKRIAGAALDVFECEPAIDCDPSDRLALADCSNVILTPHIASGTVEARQAMGRLAAQNIIAVLSGHAPLTPAA